jgi:putative ABC transport system permease protein
MAFYHRIWNAFRPASTHSALERELRFHIRERAEELQSAGIPEVEAIRQARQQFGHLTSHVERTRDMDINAAVDSFVRNLRQAVRGLAKAPAFTATVVATLALGIGANSAVFSAISAVIFRPLPFPAGDQLVKIAQVHPQSPERGIAPVRLEEWHRLNSTLQAITGYYIEDASELSGEYPERLKHALVAPRFLQVWGVAPVVGRDFTPAEEHFGGPFAVLISHRFWLHRFGGNPNAVGRKLRIGRSSVSIVGVMPAGFLVPSRDVDLWSPSPMDAPYAQSRESVWFTGIGRLKPNVTLEQARANLATIQSNLGRQFPKTDGPLKPAIEPLKEATVGGVRNSLYILFGSVSLLLLIACTNIAALLLSRATKRQHEISVRFSLGASRSNGITQLLTEVFVLALAGAALGLGLAAGAAQVFRALARDLPRIEEIALDWRIVLYSLGCAVAATLLCGVFPAIHATRRDLAAALAQAGRTQVAGGNRLQFALVGTQVCLAVALLAGAGLLLRSFQELGRVSPGFDPSHVLTFRMSMSWGETADQKGSRQRFERILEALRSVPGVEEAATTLSLPGVPGQYALEFKAAEGTANTEAKIVAQNRVVTPSYFSTLRIPLVAGDLCREDPNAITAMVNRSFANTYFPGTTPIGRHLIDVGNSYARPTEIRGVVGDARETGLDHEPVPTVYTCYTLAQPNTIFLVSTRSDPASLSATIRRKIHELEPRRSVYELTPLTSHISDAYSENRLRTILLTFFAITAVSLASIGLYGTLSYLVTVRRREIALRLALGALPKEVVRQFLAQGIRVCLVGCIAGLALAIALSKTLAGMLYGVSPTDSFTLASVAGTVLAVSAIASLLPALRAARLEPTQVLREE